MRAFLTATLFALVLLGGTSLTQSAEAQVRVYAGQRYWNGGYNANRYYAPGYYAPNVGPYGVYAPAPVVVQRPFAQGPVVQGPVVVQRQVVTPYAAPYNQRVIVTNPNRAMRVNNRYYYRW